MIKVDKGKVIINGSKTTLHREMAGLGEALRNNVDEDDRNKLVFAFMGGLLVDDEELMGDPDFDELMNSEKEDE